MPSLHLAYFGDLVVYLDSEPITRFRTRKDRALLAYLVLNRGQIHQREVLMNLLWPDDLRQAAQQSLRSSLRNIRKALGEAGDWLEAPHRGSLQIRPDTPITTDVEQFQRLSQGNPSIDKLRKAMGLYSDHFLADFYIDDANPFEAWAAGRRSLLQRQAQSNLQAIIDGLLAESRPDECLPYVDRFITLDNLNEVAHCTAMTVWAALGDRAAVVQQYETIHALLEEELGVEPADETVAVKESLLQGQYKAPTRQPATHKEPRRHNLTSEPLPFFGREALIEQLGQQIQTPDCHLLTILAPGGMGKTRLAREVGFRCLDAYADGVWFVDLVSLTSAEQIPGAVADTLQLPPSPEVSVAQQVLNFLKDRELLLILDNYEHLLPSVNYVAEMLLQAPALTILVTSRERVNLASEQTHLLTGLTVPDKATADHLQDSESGQLFLSFARRWLPVLELSNETVTAATNICQLIGGMPLGLIMAAAWLETLTLNELAIELQRDLELLQTDFKDIPARQRNMAQLFDSTWIRLTEDEQGWLAGLTIFQGGFDRHAAQTIVNLPLLGLKKLQAKALVLRAEDGRYYLHELIRQFALQKLEQQSVLFQDLGDRHSNYYCQRLVEFGREVWGPDVKMACDKADTEATNIFAAWQWAIDGHQWPSIAEALNGYTAYTDARLLNDQQRECCRSLLLLLKETQEKKLLARVLSILVTELPPGEELDKTFQQATALLNEIDPELRWQHRPYCMGLCSHYFVARDAPESLAYLNTAIQCALRFEDDFILNKLLMRRARLFASRGDNGAALADFEKGRQIAATLGMILVEAQTLSHMASTLAFMMAAEEAESIARESLALFAQMEYAVPFHLGAKDALQLALSTQGKFAENLEMLSKDLQVARASGLPWVHLLFALEATSLDLGNYDDAREYVKALIAQNGAQNSYTITLCAQGDLALLDSEYEQAVMYYEQFNAYIRENQFPPHTYTNAQQAIGYICMNDLTKARSPLNVALSVSRDRKRFPAPNALMALAMLQMKIGRIAQSWEIWAVASQYPFISQSHYVRDIAGAAIEAASLQLSAAEREAIWQKGQAADFWTYVETAAYQFAAD